MTMDTHDETLLPRRTALKAMAAAPLLATAHARPAAAETAEPARPNVLLIHCHDLGRHLACYGVGGVETPHLDRLAREGVRFAQCFAAAPQCSPSRAALFTGRYPQSNGVLGLTHANFAWVLHAEEQHIAQVFKTAGYATHCVGVFHETRSSPERCGFDKRTGKSYATDAADDAIAALEQLADDGTPFYMQAGSIEPHRLRGDADPMGFLADWITAGDPAAVSVPGYLRDTPGTRTELAELNGAVRHVDQEAGRIIEAIERLGLRENTLVIFTTDHGIAMPRAKCSVYDPGLEVALIMRYPGRAGWHGGAVQDAMLSNIDVMPSILELAGVPVPARVEGRSFAPLLAGGDYTERDEVFGEITYHDYYDPRRAIRTAQHKLILNFTTAPFFMDPSQSWRPRSDTKVPENHALAYHGHIELYDLGKDPWEQENVAGKKPYAQVEADLLVRLRAHLEAVKDPILRGAVTPPHHRAALAQLGVGLA